MKASIMLSAVAVAGATLTGNELPAATDQEQNYQGIRYACTGIAFDSRHDPRWASYPAKLIFAETSGDYLADVAVSIDDATGRSVFEAHCMAPWLLLDLPPGRYRVDATAPESPTQSVDLTVASRGQAERVVHFPASR